MASELFLTLFEGFWVEMYKGLILKAKVITLLRLGLVSLLYSVAVLLPLGRNHLPNIGAGLSSACHAGSVPSRYWQLLL